MSPRPLSRRIRHRPGDELPRRNAADYMAALRLDRQPPLIAVSAVANLLGVSRQSIYQLVATGELATLRIGPHGLRIFRDSVADYLRRQASASDATD